MPVVGRVPLAQLEGGEVVRIEYPPFERAGGAGRRRPPRDRGRVQPRGGEPERGRSERRLHLVPDARLHLRPHERQARRTARALRRPARLRRARGRWRRGGDRSGCRRGRSSVRDPPPGRPRHRLMPERVVSASRQAGAIPSRATCFKMKSARAEGPGGQPHSTRASAPIAVRVPHVVHGKDATFASRPCNFERDLHARERRERPSSAPRPPR